MSKGTAVSRFAIDDRVKFITQTELGRREDFGTILKLHASGKQGVADIRPDANDIPITGGKKLSRKLQHVVKA